MKIYFHPVFLKHDTGPGHPESPKRLRVLLDLFAEKGWLTTPAPEAEMEWIARAHGMDYINRLQDSMPEGGLAAIDGDTILCPHTWESALRAAGAVCRAVEDVWDGETTRAFCAVRPPGHHAEPDRAMGFCLLNNIMVGALHARALGARRIAIVDFDVHHGNGTDSMARLHEGVFYASTHQSPLFPGTGGMAENIPGRVFNYPLAAGSGVDAFRQAYEEHILPALDSFAPDLLLLSAGFDAHRDDPLAQMALTGDDFAWLTEKLCALAVRHCGGRVISVLEGGYALPALKRSVAAHLDILNEGG